MPCSVTDAPPNAMLGDATAMELARGGSGICAPCFEPKSGALLAASAHSGELHQLAVEGGGAALQTIANTAGSPCALGFDQDGALYVCDSAHQAILRRGSDGQLAEFVREYEGKLLKGPSAMQIDSQGNMFFTDSGPLGETTLQNPTGSVFTISADGQLLQPIALECLAHPCGIALAPNQSTIYVAEMMSNRILRFVQRPAGVYHSSVFYHFGGRMGPSAVACDQQGTLYVARYDLTTSGLGGLVSVIGADGKHLRDIELPIPSEISGIVVDLQGGALIVTESSSNCLYKISLA